MGCKARYGGQGEVWGARRGMGCKARYRNREHDGELSTLIAAILSQTYGMRVRADASACVDSGGLPDPPGWESPSGRGSGRGGLKLGNHVELCSQLLLHDRFRLQCTVSCV